ncbi:MAG: NUDIX hydrolase [Spirochaetaceae bacterium]|nr:NUDIX hydrolase [Spirochaetaceae bacterium]
MSQLIYKDISHRSIADCRIFTVDGITRQAGDGYTSEFYRINSPNWVVTVPVLAAADGDKMILVKQFRHGLGQLTTEFPSGIIEKGEEPIAAARRELLEETGYLAGKLTLLSSDSPNPALFNNTLYIFLAEDLENKGKQQLDEAERIEVLLEDKAKVIKNLGIPPCNCGSIMTNALLWYLRFTGAAK